MIAVAKLQVRRLLSVELLGRYSKMSPLPPFTLELRTARRSDRSGDSRPRKRYKVAQRLTAQERSTLIETYMAGASSAEVMRQFQLSKSAVLNLLNEAGVVRKKRAMTPAQITEAADLYAQGWSTIKLGKHFGFSPGTIWLKLTQHGIPMRQPWERH